MFRVQLLVWWRQLNAIPQKIPFKKHTFVILSLLISTLIGQEPNDVLMRHVPSEFARKKLTLTQMDGLPVLIRGDVQLSQTALFQFAGIPKMMKPGTLNWKPFMRKTTNSAIGCIQSPE